MSGTHRSGLLTTTSLIFDAAPTVVNIAEAQRNSCSSCRPDVGQQDEFATDVAAFHNGFVVDDRWPGPDGVQNPGAGRGPVPTDCTDAAVADHPSGVTPAVGQHPTRAAGSPRYPGSPSWRCPHLEVSDPIDRCDLLALAR